MKRRVIAERIIVALFMTVLSFAVIDACYPEDGIDGINGIDGIDGKDGVDGKDGKDALQIVYKLESNDACENGGWNVVWGWDNNENLIYDDGDTFVMSVPNCNGVDGLNTAYMYETISPSDDINSLCEGMGGWLIWNGLDINGNNKLDEDEKTNSFTICNGQDGLDGTNGIDGQNGSDGQDGTSGTNGTDGVDGTNGVDGTDGTDGSDGNDGSNVVIPFLKRIVYHSNACGDSGVDGPGGVTVEIYDDIDENGILDREIDFYLVEHTLCYGMTIEDALAIGYELDDYFDVDVNITEGSNTCLENPDAKTIIVMLDDVELIRFAVCPI